MKYNKNEFIVIPNKSLLRGMSPNLQVVFIWLCEHSDKNMQSFPSRKTLAQECGVSVRTLDRSIQELVNKGLIAKSARHRDNEQSTNLYEVVIPAQGGDTVARGSDTVTPGGATKTAHRTQPIINSTQLTQNSTNVELAPAGNQDINGMFTYWEETTGLPISARVKLNRFACSNLLKKHGPDKLRQLINGVAAAQGDQYAPRIADFTQLQGKLNELLVWGKSRTTSNRGVQL